MPNKKSSHFYSVLWNGKVQEESDKQFQSKLKPFAFRHLEDTNFIKSAIDCDVLKHGKIRGTSPYYITLIDSKTKNRSNFYVGYVKNAGMKSFSKRLQISAKIPNFNATESFYALGFLPTGDDEIVVLVEMKSYVQNKIRSTSKNNSSLWIDFENITEAYFGRKLVIEQDHDKKRYIFRKSQTDILRIVFSTIFGLNVIDEEKIQPSVSTEINVKKIEKLARNSVLRDQIIERSNYTCELCKKTETFQDKQNKWYFEAHHLIPFNKHNQEKFRFTLDHISNLVCLCPECHRKVHYSDLKEQISSLAILINKKPYLKTYYRVDNVQDLYSFYKEDND
jgi:hypothetical protein